MDRTEEYLESLLPSSPSWAEEMEKFAKDHQIPIMEPLGIQYLMQLIRVTRPRRILEIGAAIGYSALRMLEAYPMAEIVTVERDAVRFSQAETNLEKLDEHNHIALMYGDALELQEQISQKGPYDVLFIDAAKGQYQKFFESYAPMVTEKGIIVSDNVLFKGFVAGRNDNPRMQKIGNKIRKYNEWLIEHPDYHTSIIPIGDGIALTVKR
ncbi:putative O-methyltransferase YrrM [Thalassobacillus devorans]|uniref:tRNA 5-hydroxyuridine methyltransferase n=1 Tax=Thalassobacillus devorans TaxID=279813 RepID=A0ABQ1PA61_9BACI|nr:O-methyltransferase [Thalassobacillus devorans]NIK29743.1 putative O-methyltransferase YrrM [Thalassobacillus devorans]GGC92456.1 putative O-methyltransferase YrrM [Thalassobacillus devorans]